MRLIIPALRFYLPKPARAKEAHYGEEVEYRKPESTFGLN